MSVKRVEIGNATLKATLLDFGASLCELRLHNVPHSVVLGYPDVQQHANDGQYMGAVIGRYANRIATGIVELNGRLIELDTNEHEQTHLHGGSVGLGTKLWSLKEQTESSATFELISPDGDMGYPGVLQVEVKYEIKTASTLRLTFKATADQDTIINICHHPYFNLDGLNTIDEHNLFINSDQYLPSDQWLIPTGVIANVAHTEFDYTCLSRLHDCPYNNTYCLHTKPVDKLSHAATLEAGGVAMQLWSTQPGLHLYDGYKLRNTTKGHDGKSYQKRSGVCLETQAWPDSPNWPHFPNVILKTGDVYEQTTEYRFMMD